MKAEIIWPLAVGIASLVVCKTLYGWGFDVEAVAPGVYDAHYVNILGRALWRGTDIAGDRLALRGYFYPMLVTGLMLLSPKVFFGAQLLAIAGGTFCLVRAERQLAGRVIFTPLAILSISLLVAPSLMMSEALAFLASSAALLAFLTGRRNGAGVFLLFLTALIKPAFLPVAVISTLFGIGRNRASALAILGVIAIWTPQLVLTGVLNGKPQLTSAGQLNFQQRFYPAVVGTQELGMFVRQKSQEAEAARARRPGLAEQVGYVLSHPGAMVKTWSWILWTHHLKTVAGNARRDNTLALKGPQQWLEKFSGRANWVFVVLLIPAAAGGLVFLRRVPVSAYPATFIGPSLFVTAPLVYFQGDRIVFLAYLLALPFVGYFLKQVWRA